MSWNVPDDWNSYYYSCGCHASAGCDCREGQLENAERPWLEASGYDLDDGTWEKLILVKTHKCRRNHRDGKIKVGQTYRRSTYRIIDDETGESWIRHTKRVLK